MVPQAVLVALFPPFVTSMPLHSQTCHPHVLFQAAHYFARAFLIVVVAIVVTTSLFAITAATIIVTFLIDVCICHSSR